MKEKIAEVVNAVAAQTKHLAGSKNQKINFNFNS